MSPFEIPFNNVTSKFVLAIFATNKEKKQGDNIFSWNYMIKLICIIDIRHILNPFAPEPPATARADPGPFYPLWRHEF